MCALVTGVQTCAFPILRISRHRLRARSRRGASSGIELRQEELAHAPRDLPADRFPRKLEADMDAGAERDVLQRARQADVKQEDAVERPRSEAHTSDLT